MIGYAYRTGLLYKKVLIKAKRGRKTHGCRYVSVYLQTRRRIKTQLEVPDDRLSNAVTLSDHCATQIMFIF